MTQKGEGYGASAIVTKDQAAARESYLKRIQEKQD